MNASTNKGPYIFREDRPVKRAPEGAFGDVAISVTG